MARRRDNAYNSVGSRIFDSLNIVLLVGLGALTLLGCYHPSQQNTFTGRLTPAMMDDVLGRARELGAPPAASG